ncbi:MAG: sigma-70 family RNA polymerase sigma factor [Verrucomicrobiaceae bacterium]|nr:sigma-70 family RNA polymerase sigma factor [Verrucomicrobiaceae bacterium]
MHEDADTALMLRLQGGEDVALNELMTKWQKPLVTFIYRYIGNEADALDLAQETFVRVFESRHRYEAKAKFSTWLFTIASNLSRNYIRWKTRHPTVAFESADEHDRNPASAALESNDPSPAEQAEAQDVAAAVKREIHELPHDLRMALLLFEYEDLSHEEISRVLRCSAKAVETRLYRARKILRQALEGMNYAR